MDRYIQSSQNTEPERQCSKRLSPKPPKTRAEPSANIVREALFTAMSQIAPQLTSYRTFPFSDESTLPRSGRRISLVSGPMGPPVGRPIAPVLPPAMVRAITPRARHVSPDRTRRPCRAHAPLSRGLHPSRRRSWERHPRRPLPTSSVPDRALGPTTMRLLSRCPQVPTNRRARDCSASPSTAKIPPTSRQMAVCVVLMPTPPRPRSRACWAAFAIVLCVPVCSNLACSSLL